MAATDNTISTMSKAPPIVAPAMIVFLVASSEADLAPTGEPRKVNATMDLSTKIIPYMIK